MSSTTVTLKYPVDIVSATGVKTTLTSVTLRRIKAKDLKFMPADGDKSPAKMLPLIASLTGLDISTVEEIDLEDMNLIAESLVGFSTAFLKTGNLSSGE